MQRPQGLGKWLSCIIGVPEASYGRPNLNGRVMPDGGRDPSTDSSDSDSSDDESNDPFEEREDAYVPAIEAVSAQQHKVCSPSFVCQCCRSQACTNSWSGIQIAHDMRTSPQQLKQ